MTTRDLPASGTIRLSEVIAEFGKGNNLLDYLGEGGVTSSAPLKLTDFYGKAAGPSPPELIGGTGYFWQGNGTPVSGSFNVPISAGDTVVALITFGNAWTGNYPTLTVNGETAASKAGYFATAITGYPGLFIQHRVMSSSASSISWNLDCPRSMSSPAIYLFPLKGSYVKESGTNTHGKFVSLQGQWAYIKNGNMTNEITNNNTSFVVSINANNSNYTNGWYTANHEWASGGGTGKFDYIHLAMSMKNNHCEGAFRALPLGEEINFDLKQGYTMKTAAGFIAQKYVAAPARLSPAEIMAEQFAIQEMEMAAEAERLKSEPAVPEPPNWEDE
jgi:hypothetical protein